MRPSCAFLLAVLFVPLAASAQLTANVGPVEVDFGTVRIGQTVTVPVTVENTHAFSISFAGGGFSVSNGFGGSSGTCSGSLAAGASCAFNYSFRPRDASGDLLENSTSLSLNSSAGSMLVPLTFRGRGTGKLVDLSPTTIDFGEWLVGEPVTVPVDILNTTSGTVTFAGGGFNTSNGFGAGGGTCGGSLASGASCHFNYTFTPTGLGTFVNSTSLSVIAAAPSFSQSFPIQVRGTGVSAVELVGIAPVEIDFGSVQLGRALTVPFQFENFNASQINYAGGGFSPGSSGEGSLSGSIGGGSGCTSTTANSGSICSIVYQFRPREAGTFSGETAMSFSKTGQSQFVSYAFTGTGYGPLASVSPVDIVFGEVTPGQDLTAPVTITNTGDSNLTNFIGGGVGSPFSRTEDCPSSLAPGDSCKYTYRFQSPDADPRHATTYLSFTDTYGIQPSVRIRLYANGAPEPATAAAGVAAIAAIAALRRRAQASAAHAANAASPEGASGAGW